MSLFSDFIVSSRLLEGGQMVHKRDVIQQLLQAMADDGHIAQSDVPGILDTVLRREALGTTGIGNGIAIPHARHTGVERRVAILGIFRPPVDFDSLDGEPIDIAILILGPRELRDRQRRESLQRADRLMRLLQNQEFCDRLRQATSASNLLDRFLTADIKME